MLIFPPQNQKVAFSHIEKANELVNEDLAYILLSTISYMFKQTSFGCFPSAPQFCFQEKAIHSFK